ncbi:hypothetical protein NM688_g5831 [Phlebia brevispora]|uniref:Uncharacterized protein n=1 Tax=Phlebia brevispora TaxID=194682 RepID=A0ACC1SPH3_9APHY|nr:hypothetical protein NM688_g5831 [Phlebia brevispora]
MSNNEAADVYLEYLIQRTSIASLALVAYEYIITFQDEVSIFWFSKWTAGKALFLATRYLMILSLAFEVVIPTPTWKRSVQLILNEIFVQALVFCVAAFSSLRGFALCDRNIALALLVLICNMIPIIINLYIGISAEHISAPEDSIVPRCQTWPTSSPESLFMYVSISRKSLFKAADRRHSLSIFSRLGPICGDLLTIVITWIKTYRPVRQSLESGVRFPMAIILFRDGTIYFLVILILNLVILVIDVITHADLQPANITNYDLAMPLTYSLTPILICRFLLNLREMDQSRDDIYGHTSDRLQRVLDNLGEQLSRLEDGEAS